MILFYGFCWMLIISALWMLWRLTIIDFKTMLLPNHLVLGFFIAGILFHLTGTFLLGIELRSFLNLGLSALMTLISLLGIRAVFNAIKKMDTFGLGDVKLLTAGAVWLGHTILFTISLGAFLGLVIGVGAAYLKRNPKKPFRLQGLIFPAGPGYCLALALFIIFDIGLSLFRF